MYSIRLNEYIEKFVLPLAFQPISEKYPGPFFMFAEPMSIDSFQIEMPALVEGRKYII